MPRLWTKKVSERFESVIINYFIHCLSTLLSCTLAPFPDIVDTPTFGDTIQLVCERHFPEELLNTTQEDYDTFVDEKCSEMLANITAVEIDEDKSIVQYTSEICDALGLELPHPNITISLRHASPHMLNHKPGGPHLRMRHVMTDVSSYSSCCMNLHLISYCLLLSHRSFIMQDITSMVSVSLTLPFHDIHLSFNNLCL